MSEMDPAAEVGKEGVARRIVGTRLFLISYVPLWMIFAIRSHGAKERVVFWGLAAVGLIDAIRLIGAGLRRSHRTIRFEDISEKGGEAAGYLATYLLPFIAGPPKEVAGWLTYGVYFLVAWAVYVPSSLCLVNPTLYVLGWRVVEGTRKGRRELIVCQSPPRREGELVARLMGGVGWVTRASRQPWISLQRHGSEKDSPPDASE